jgi:hypothetical protein
MSDFLIATVRYTLRELENKLDVNRSSTVRIITWL